MEQCSFDFAWPRETARLTLQTPYKPFHGDAERSSAHRRIVTRRNFVAVPAKTRSDLMPLIKLVKYSGCQRNKRNYTQLRTPWKTCIPVHRPTPMAHLCTYVFVFAPRFFAAPLTFPELFESNSLQLRGTGHDYSNVISVIVGLPLARPPIHHQYFKAISKL